MNVVERQFHKNKQHFGNRPSTAFTWTCMQVRVPLRSGRVGLHHFLQNILQLRAAFLIRLIGDLLCTVKIIEGDDGIHYIF